MDPGAAPQREHTELDLAEALRRRAEELGEERPRFVLYILDSQGSETLQRCIDGIPKAVDPWLEEVVVIVGPEGRQSPVEAERIQSGRPFALRFHRRPRDDGWGGARKAAFEHAVGRGFDYLAVLREGVHPPETLPLLVHAALAGRAPAIASRLLDGRAALREGMPLHRWLAHRLVTALQNRVLGLRLHDYHSSLRLYPVQALEGIPYQLDSDDRAFDVEILIQLRAMGIVLHEVPASSTWREDTEGRDELRHVVRACRTAVAYRLHQLHVTRDGRFLVDPGVRYTLKLSPTGSHMQIVAAIRPGTRILDLGCSQGLLARPLREKDVRVTGVDAGPPRGLAEELETYHRRDLEEALELPDGRVFDFVVVADVIEHLRRRQQLLRGARRFLKENGRLVVSTPNVALWFYRLSLLVGRFEYGPRGILDRTHVHLYTRASFRREVERAGYRIVGERVTALPFEVVFESTGKSRLVRGLARLYHTLARGWPELLAYQIILEAEITTLDDEATFPAED